MATLISLPHEIQAHIADFIRNPDNVQSPFAKEPQIAIIQQIHRNLGKVPLWKKFVWKELIRKWRDEKIATEQRAIAGGQQIMFQYIYGTLSDRMIKRGWEEKINKVYRHQKIYVKTTLMEGNGVNSGLTKLFKTIHCEVTLEDLIIGFHPLSSALDGDNGRNDMYEASNGTLQLTVAGTGLFKRHLVRKPSAMTLIPQNKRREWLLECFMSCVLIPFVEKMIEKKKILLPPLDDDRFDRVVKRETGCFMKDFKEMMHIPSNYPLSQTDLFKMFLEELGVRACKYYCCDTQSMRESQSIEELCRHEIDMVV